jgi:hypothetical protein
MKFNNLLTYNKTKNDVVTPPTTTTRLGGVTTLRENNKTNTIEI